MKSYTESLENYFLKSNLNKNQIDKLITYAVNLKKQNLPVIYELEHLAKTVGLDIAYLYKAINRSSSFYREFDIVSKNGKRRTIFSAYPKLAYIQKWIKSNILDRLEVSEASFGYVKGRSILENAKYHLHNDDLLKLDLKDYFSNISRYSVEKIFISLGYTKKLSLQLSGLCCYNSFLPQGACTSPVLSNLICREMDKKIIDLSKNSKLIYSRYADDISISGEFISQNFIDSISKIITDHSFELNSEKFVLKRKNQRKLITGLCITGKKVRVQKKYRREFRKMAHFLLMNKEKMFNGDKGPLDPSYIDRAIGQANFIKTIEPDNIYANKVLPELINIKKLLIL